MRESPFDRHKWKVDLLLVVVAVVLTAAVLLGPETGLLVRWILGVIFVLFLPGYALVAALFPEQPTATPRDPMAHASNRNPDWMVRIALSLVISVMVVAALVVVIDLVASIRLAPVVGGISAVTLIGVAIATVRRIGYQRHRRATPFTGRTAQKFSAGTTLQNVALLLTILALVVAVAFVGTTPSQGEAYTESYLVTENEDGEYVIDENPTTFVEGDGQPISLGIENYEGQSMSYEVLVVVQEVEADGSIADYQQLDRFTVDVPHSEQSITERHLEPTMVGDGLRLQFLVYKDGAPGDPDLSEPTSADQTLQIWIDVVEEADA